MRLNSNLPLDLFGDEKDFGKSYDMDWDAAVKIFILYDENFASKLKEYFKKGLDDGVIVRHGTCVKSKE